MSRILLVEDNPDVRAVLDNVLSDAGYHVVTATNVREGRRRLYEGECDLLLTDGRLPDGTGITLADIASARGIPVLILTGYAFILSQLADADQTDKYRVLSKPIRSKELVAAVEETLATKGLAADISGHSPLSRRSRQC